jgi:two-component system chemotaxis sensor kinase CheA
MPEQDKEFQERLLATFRVEAEEHVAAISLSLIDFERSRDEKARAAHIETAFREVHSLKGAARAVNFREIEAVCQSAEGILAQAKRGEAVLGPTDLDKFHGAAKEIERLLSLSRGEPKEGIQAKAEAPALSVPTLAAAPAPVLSRTATVKAEEETLRVASKQLDMLLLRVEELVPARWEAAQRSAEMGELATWSARRAREWAGLRPITLSLMRSVKGGEDAPDLRIGELRRLLEFLERDDEPLVRFDERLQAISRSTERAQHAMGAMVDGLQRETKRLMLRPFSSITESLPAFLREFCRENGKDAELSVIGADIEIDRRILQEIKDPLMHLVRNGIDHGIESPERRAAAHKAPRGAMTIAITQKSANKVEVSVSDDGAGIDLSKVRDAAVRSALVSAEAAHGMSEQEIQSFIYKSGISTSPVVTDISGRGLGMAIVREKVEKLGGGIAIEARAGGGTTFRLLLPLTLSTIRGILVRTGERRFLIPETFVERVVLARSGDIGTVENRAALSLGIQTVSLVRLRDALALPSNAEGDAPGGAGGDSSSRGSPAVVLAVGGARVAFLVDEVLGEQEVLAKGLGPQLASVRNVGGAAVLATGELVPILNAADLMKAAAATAAPLARPAAEESAPHRASILVADDSITARTLIKGILEAAGYSVRTAADGAEAFASLREGDFDLLVSDVDMPRLNGFDLTAKIRADKRLSGLPVILVTALESLQDRERGIDVGASAYIVKSNFEQSNLLEAVRRCT